MFSGKGTVTIMLDGDYGKAAAAVRARLPRARDGSRADDADAAAQGAADLTQLAERDSADTEVLRYFLAAAATAAPKGLACGVRPRRSASRSPAYRECRVAGPVMRREHAAGLAESRLDDGDLLVATSAMRDPALAGTASPPDGAVSAPRTGEIRQPGATVTSPAASAHRQRPAWILHEMDPGTAAHCIVVTQQFAGEMDVPALVYALGAALARNIPGDARMSLQEDDACELDELKVATLLEYTAREPADVLRTRLFRRPGETLVLIVAHHSLADVWSMTTLARELETLYFERTGGTPAPLPEPATADRDFVRLHRWVGGSRSSVRAALNHAPPARPRPAVTRDGVPELLPLGARIESCSGHTPFHAMQNASE